jgi:short subunit dehydrogenase-like uncharacterized protein
LSTDAVEVVVYGANGGAGQRACEALRASGVAFAVAGRDAAAIARLAGELGVPGRACAAAALAPAITELRARVVLCAAGPLARVAVDVLDAAVAAGAAYVDVGGEQAVLRELHEAHESAARRAGIVAVPGCGLDCAVGDLGAAWAASVLTGAPLEGPIVRAAPAARIAEDAPLDELAVTYVYDDLALSAAQQRAAFQRVGARPLGWRRDRWEPMPGAGRRVNAGPAFGGERAAVPAAAGDALAIPRHVAAHVVSAFVSPTRRAGGALGLLSRALPLLPRAATELLSPTHTPDAEVARARFAIIIQARRGFDEARLVVRGADPRGTSAAIAAWVARALARRDGAGPLGMRSPAELLRPDLALRALADACGLTIELGF